MTQTDNIHITQEILTLIKDVRHRGSYKTLRNDVAAFDASDAMIGIVFETATPFDTPRRMAELISWLG